MTTCEHEWEMGNPKCLLCGYDEEEAAEQESKLKELADAAGDERDAASRVSMLEQELEEAGVERSRIDEAIGNRA